MSILNQLNALTGDSVWIYVSAAFALVLAIAKIIIYVTKALETLVDFLRSERWAWMLGVGEKLVASLGREFRQTARHFRPKAGRKIELSNAMSNAIFYYVFFGLLTLEWFVLLAAGSINPAHLPAWKITLCLAGGTVILVPFAVWFGGLAAKERKKAERIWQQCRAEGLRAYAALIATPTALVGAALIVSNLQQMGNA